MIAARSMAVGGTSPVAIRAVYAIAGRSPGRGGAISVPAGSGPKQESAALRARAWFVVLAVAAIAGASTAYLRSGAAPDCGSDAVLGQVYAELRDRFHLESVFLNDIEARSGWYFSGRRDCSAEVTEIRGNVAASGMPWREVRYRIVYQDVAPYAAVTVVLGGNVPLAPKPRTLWQRMLADL